MPLFKTESTGPGGAWGLWKIAETEVELAFSSGESCPEEVIHPQKRLEWLAGRTLLRTLVEKVGLTYEGIRKDEHGKPHLKSRPDPISLSHSYPYVAAQVDSRHSVGIDVEQLKSKLFNIAERVFSKDELKDAGDNLTKLCIYWCAKEALYKIYGKRNLLFTDHLRVSSFSLSESGSFTGRIVFEENESVIPLGYQVFEDFVVVYTGIQK